MHAIFGSISSLFGPPTKKRKLDADAPKLTEAQIPEKIWVKIFSYLPSPPARDLVNVSLVSKRWHNITNETSLLGRIRLMRALLGELFNTVKTSERFSGDDITLHSYSPSQQVLLTTRRTKDKEEVIENHLGTGHKRTLCHFPFEKFGNSEVVVCGNAHYLCLSEDHNLRLLPFRYDYGFVGDNDNLYCEMTIAGSLSLSSLDFPVFCSEKRFAVAGRGGEENEAPSHLLVYNFSTTQEKCYMVGETPHIARFPTIEHDISFSSDFDCRNLVLTEDYVYAAFVDYLDGRRSVCCYPVSTATAYTREWSPPGEDIELAPISENRILVCVKHTAYILSPEQEKSFLVTPIRVTEEKQYIRHHATSTQHFALHIQNLWQDTIELYAAKGTLLHTFSYSRQGDEEMNIQFIESHGLLAVVRARTACIDEKYCTETKLDFRDVESGLLVYAHTYLASEKEKGEMVRCNMHIQFDKEQRITACCVMSSDDNYTGVDYWSWHPDTYARIYEKAQAKVGFLPTN